MRKLPSSAAVVSVCLLLGAMAPLAISAAQIDEPGCEDGWASHSSAAFPGKIKVWAACTGAYDEELRQTLSIVESFWGPMTEFMGTEPLPDAETPSAGGDTAIDFYLADQEIGVPQRGSGAPAARSYGYSRAAPPLVGVSNSGFVVMRRGMLGDPQFSDTLAHEFFHVLQQARNVKLTFNWNIRPDDDPDWDTLAFADGESDVNGRFQVTPPVRRQQSYGVIVIARGYLGKVAENKQLASPDNPDIIDLGVFLLQSAM